jgi:hypothetical protein
MKKKYKSLLSMWITKGDIAKAIWVSRWTLWSYEKWNVHRSHEKIKNYLSKKSIEDIIYDIEYSKTLYTIYKFIDKNKKHIELPDDILYDLPQNIKTYLKCTL